MKEVCRVPTSTSMTYGRPMPEEASVEGNLTCHQDLPVVPEGKDANGAANTVTIHAESTSGVKLVPRCDAGHDVEEGDIVSTFSDGEEEIGVKLVNQCNAGHDVEEGDIVTAFSEEEIGMSSKTDQVNLNQITERLKESIPAVVSRLHTAGVLYEYISFHDLVAVDQYPLENISFLLWLETVRWYSVSSSTNMSYWESTLRFWECGYNMFHGKFLRFLSGPKNLGQVIDDTTTRGCYDPHTSHINFAVPDVSIIRKRSEETSVIPSEVRPGVIEESLDMLVTAKANVPHVLSVDGKKVASGLSSNSGDVDLFGHEDGLCLAERLERLNEEEEHVNQIVSMFEMYGNDIRTFPTPIPITDMLKETIRLISGRLRDLREMKVKQDLALKKFKTLGGDDWRSSKYVFAISSIQCQLYRINVTIEHGLSCVQKLCQLGCTLYDTGHLMRDGSDVQQGSLINLVQLTTPESLPNELKEDSQFIKQRTPEWFSIRRQAPVSGSTLFDAVGLSTLKNQQEHFDVHIRRKDPKPASEEQQKFMDHGTVNECNGIATLVTQFLPFFHPGLTYFEEGVYKLSTEDKPDKTLIAISPDGSLRKCDDMSVVGPADLGVEVKCPFPNDYKTPVHYSMPERYVTQVLAEMVALQVPKLLYISYSAKSSTVFEVSFDEGLWNDIVTECHSIYSQDCPTRPSSTSQNARALKTRLKEFTQRNVRLIAEVPSVKCDYSTTIPSLTTEGSPYVCALPLNSQPEAHVISGIDTLLEAKRIIGECHQICRLKGTEVLVFMISDMDRSWHVEVPHSIPVAYGLKGYSLSGASVRSMIEYVLNICKRKGIYIPCVSFDGQWVSLVTRSVDGKPLTRLQLQKDIWLQAKATAKSSIVAHLKNLSVRANLERNGTVIVVSSAEKLVAKLNTPREPSLWKKGSRTSVAEDLNKEPSGDSDQSVQIEWLPDGVLDSEDNAAVALEVATSDLPVQLEIDYEKETDLLPDLIEMTSQEPCACNVINSHDSSSKTCSVETVPDTYCIKILDGWKTAEANKAKKKWSAANVHTVRECLRKAEALKSLTVQNLDHVLEVITPLHKETTKKSWAKWEKINFLSRVLGDGSRVPEPKKQYAGKVSSLKDLSARILAGKSYPKMVLNVVYAKAINDEKVANWEDGFGAKISGMDEPVDWYYHPEKSEERQQLEVKVLDGHHLLVNLRVKVCKDGLPGYHIPGFLQVL